MAEKQGVSDLYKKNAEKAEKDKRLRDAVSIFFILFGSVIVAVNLNTFVEQGKLVPGGFSGLAKLIQRVGLAFFGVKISFTFLNVVFNAIPAVFAYRIVGKKFTILSCVSLLTVSAACHPHHRRPSSHLRIRRNHQRPGHEPHPEQPGQRRRNGFHRHVPLHQI